MKQLLLLPILFWMSQQVYTQEATDNAFSDVPITLSPSKHFMKSVLPKAAISIGYAGAVYFVYQKADRSIQHEWQEGKNTMQSNIAHSVSPLGVSTTNWVACGITTGVAYLTQNTRLQRASMLWLGSLAINEVATNTLKNQFQRYRPSTGMPYNSFDGVSGKHLNRSFPSSHTSTAFATATIFANVYKDKKWVPPFAYGMATLVGLSRVYDNAHWSSDVMAGAAVGFLSAKAMLLIDKRLSAHHIHLYPQVGFKHAGASLVYQF